MSRTRASFNWNHRLTRGTDTTTANIRCSIVNVTALGVNRIEIMTALNTKTETTYLGWVGSGMTASSSTRTDFWLAGVWVVEAAWTDRDSTARCFLKRLSAETARSLPFRLATRPAGSGDDDVTTAVLRDRAYNLETAAAAVDGSPDTSWDTERRCSVGYRRGTW